MFLIISVMMLTVVGLLAAVIYLVDFARASRGDALFLPASSGGTRRARRVTGMYTRGSGFDDLPGLDDHDDYSQDGGDQLISR